MFLNLKKKHIIFNNININNINFNNLEISYSDKYNGPFIAKDINFKLSYYKGLIDIKNNNGCWDRSKKISNPYELINHNNCSVSLINPISRSYFKFLELIQDYSLISNKKVYNYVALAEGPGGFVECFIKYRKSKFLGRNDIINCMTLRSKSPDIPNWNKAKTLFKKNNVNISYGEDGTGNLYNIQNIKYLSNKLGNNKVVDLVSADGGFDYSTNFNTQEIVSCKLIFSEIICALNISKKGAHFILKIFDIYSLLTIKILYILSLFYKQLIIVKPFTSRPANSEKYIVCKDFLGISKSTSDSLYTLLEEWNKSDRKINDIIGIKVPKIFIDNIYNINKYYAKQQITNILQTLIFIERPLQNNDLNYIKKKQLLYCVEWCRKYNNPLNYKNIKKIHH